MSREIIARGGHGCEFCVVRYMRGGQPDGVWHYDMIVSWHHNAEFAISSVRTEPDAFANGWISTPTGRRWYMHIVRHAPFPLKLDFNEIPWQDTEEV